MGDRMVVGLTQPQLGDYDSYCHNQLVGEGNVRVLVHVSMMFASLIYLPNDEMQTIVDVVGSFVIWPESPIDLC